MLLWVHQIILSPISKVKLLNYKLIIPSWILQLHQLQQALKQHHHINSKQYSLHYCRIRITLCKLKQRQATHLLTPSNRMQQPASTLVTKLQAIHSHLQARIMLLQTPSNLPTIIMLSNLTVHSRLASHSNHNINRTSHNSIFLLPNHPIRDLIICSLQAKLLHLLSNHHLSAIMLQLRISSKAPSLIQTQQALVPFLSLLTSILLQVIASHNLKKLASLLVEARKTKLAMKKMMAYLLKRGSCTKL